MSTLIMESSGLSEKLYRKISRFITEETGIQLPDNKKSMVEARLRKRMRINKIDSYEEYANFVFSEEGKRLELVNMIDSLTTNKTSFFREPDHFDVLTREVLPTLLASRNSVRPLQIWSAGCSSGQEPYTLAIVLSEFARANRGFDFEITATDISTEILEKARRGIYSSDKVETIPLALKQKYFLRSKNPANPEVRVTQQLRQKVRFGYLNLMDEGFRFEQQMDIIFCRNVMIYFDNPTRKSLFEKFIRVLNPGGYIFIGHSESINGLQLPLKTIAATVYQSTSH